MQAKKFKKENLSLFIQGEMLNNIASTFLQRNKRNNAKNF